MEPIFYEAALAEETCNELVKVPFRHREHEFSILRSNLALPTFHINVPLGPAYGANSAWVYYVDYITLRVGTTAQPGLSNYLGDQLPWRYCA
jgi:hypothetical protein